MATGRITSFINSVPFQTSIIDKSSSSANSDQISYLYESFFNSLAENTQTLANKSFTNTLRNPDFSFLSANGTNPVTEASGSPFEVVSNWFANSGGGNTYTITPTSAATIPFFGTGSNYHLNVNFSNLASTFYMSNLNYSSTSQFNSIAKYSGKTVTFSGIAISNNANQSELNFSANAENIAEYSSAPFYLQEGINLIAVDLNIPDLSGTAANPADKMEFRMNVRGLDGTMGGDFFYLKSEIANQPTPLQINHTLEQLLITNLV